MAVLEIGGLLNGRRLRECSAAARWAFPYYYLLSNGYARIELDYDAIAEHFISFRGTAPSAAEVKSHFEEYESNHLLFVYQIGKKQWGQWDTKRSHTPRHKTAIDKRSPAPPENEYQAWLREQHEDWGLYHWKSTPPEIDVTNQQVRKPSENLKDFPKPAENLCLGVGVGVGVGGGGGGGGGKNHHTPNPEIKPDSKDDDFKPSECSPVVGRALGISGQRNWVTTTEAIENFMHANPGKNARAAADEICGLWNQYRASPQYKKFPMNPEKWLSSGEFLRTENWSRPENKPVFVTESGQKLAAGYVPPKKKTETK